MASKKFEVVGRGIPGFIGQTTLFRQGTDKHVLCVSYKVNNSFGKIRSETLAYESNDKGNPINGIILASVDSIEDHEKFIQRLS